MSNQILASIGDVVVHEEDVDTLDEWLNDQIIDFYFEHLSQRFCENNKKKEEKKTKKTKSGDDNDDGDGDKDGQEGENGDAPSSSPSSSPSVVFVGASASFLCAHGGASAVAGPLKLAEADLVFLPVNDNKNVNRAGGGSHWSLLVFDRRGGGGGVGAGEEKATAADDEGESRRNNGGGGAGPSSPSRPSGATSSQQQQQQQRPSFPVFRAYDSLGYKNTACARELSRALEEHLILSPLSSAAEEGDEEKGRESDGSRRLRRRKLDATTSAPENSNDGGAPPRTRSVAPPPKDNFVQGRCPRQGNASDCGIYILALAERIAEGRTRGLPYREIEEQLFREVTPSFAEEERERLRNLVDEIGKSRGKGTTKNKTAKKK